MWARIAPVQRVVEVVRASARRAAAAATGGRCTPASALRSSFAPASSTRCDDRAAGARRRRSGARSCTVIPSLSFAYRQASCRSGESGASSSSVLTARNADLAILGAVDLDPHAVDEVRLGRREPRVEAGRVVGRVDPGRQRDDLHVEALLHGELHPAQRRRLAGGVAVEREPEPLRQPAELLQLLARSAPCPCTRRPARSRPAAARSRRCCPRRRTRGPRARSRRAPCRARRRPSPCGRAPTRACSRTSPAAGRPRAAAAPGSRARGRARRRAGRAAGVRSSRRRAAASGRRRAAPRA